jgi:uncharacterized protein YbjT (DUF2867 family)
MNSPLVVVLGGTGFVGSHLVPALLRHGWRVKVASRNRDDHLALSILPDVELVTCNIHQPDALARLLSGASAAINLVGILNEPGRDGSGFRRAHVDLTRGLIAACKQAGVRRLLQMSALNAGRGKSHYLQTRGEAEALVRDSGLDWTIFQPSVIFGDGDGLFYRFAALLRFAPLLPLARAKARFAPVYIGDVVAAFLHALRDPATVGKSYELYGPQVLTLAEIVRYTAQQLGLRRAVIGMPDLFGRLQGLLFDFVPLMKFKAFSTDNYKSLLVDSVGGIDGLYALGIEKTPIEAVIPRLLHKSHKQMRLDYARRRE